MSGIIPNVATAPLSHVELSTWLTPDGQLAPTQLVGLRSLDSSTNISLNFINNSDVPAEIIWLTYCGEEKLYLELEPGGTTIMRTFKTHPWIARIARTASPGARLMLGGRMVAFGEVDGQCFAITRPPLLQWSLHTHKHFPKAFRDIAKALLLSHHSLPTPGAADPADLSTARCKRANHHGSAFRAISCLCAFICSCVNFARPEDAAPQRLGPEAYMLLRSLPLELLVHVISFMAPPQRQCITMRPDGHPGIAPALLPCAPPSGPVLCLTCRKVHTF